VLHEFVRAGEIGRVGEAILRLFHSLGNRENRQRARLKYVRKKLGDQGFRETYATLRAVVDAEAANELALPPPANRAPAGPVTEAEPAPRDGAYLSCARHRSSIKSSPATSAPTCGCASATQRAKKCASSDASPTRFGDGTVRLTIDQNLLLPWVDKRSVPALYGRLLKAGLARLDLHTVRDVTSCQGADTCNLAVTSSRAVASAITAKLEAEGLGATGDAARTLIKVSGCPNSCGQHHIADLGFHGGAKNTGDGAFRSISYIWAAASTSVARASAGRS